MKHAAFLAAAFLAAASASAQDALSAAKDLYASAAYEDALSALARVKEGAPELEQEVDEYRAFALFALGRTKEAEAAVHAVIRRDPLAVPDPRDASPRIMELFAQVRKELLPELIRDGYRSVRTRLDMGSLQDAVPQLTQVSRLIDYARKEGVLNDALEDMDVIITGFLELARSAADLTAAQAAIKAAPPAPVAEPAPAQSIAASGARVYSEADEHVTPPKTVRQQVPTIPPAVARAMGPSQASGILEIVIDQKGEVESAVIRESLSPFYDSMLLAAAKTWRYRPATNDGQPVKYMKRIGLSMAADMR